MRGGGTSQAGQAIGAGLQVDTSKYYNQILELNAEERWVRVQPGIVLDELNAALRPHGLRFAPDVSTASRATIGGMMANNSSGARSVLYGKTIDHVIELEVVLADGSLSRIRRRTAKERTGDTLAASASAPCIATGRGTRGRNRPPLSEGPAPRGRLQPRRVRARPRAVQPGEDDGRLGRHARP
jgi:FAD/FMN-containing dehydrogenase